MDNPKQLLLDAFKWRHACKHFDANRKVKDEDIEFILEIARLSPSSFGLEPWNFLIFKDFGVLKKIKPYAWGLENSLNGASHIIVILSRKKPDLLPHSEYTEYMMEKVHQLPLDLLSKRCNHLSQFFVRDIKAHSEKEIFGWAAKQTYIPLANMITAAALLKIDTCPVEGFNYQKVEDFLCDEGLLDKNLFGITAMLSLGYRSTEPKRKKTRQSIERVMHYAEQPKVD